MVVFASATSSLFQLLPVKLTVYSYLIAGWHDMIRSMMKGGMHEQAKRSIK